MRTYTRRWRQCRKSWVRRVGRSGNTTRSRRWSSAGSGNALGNKARLYDQLVESREPVSAQQTIPILVKYSRMMNNLFAEIQKVVPPGGTPRRVLYQGPPGSPTGPLYEEMGEWPSYRIRPRLQNPASRDLRGPDADNHLSPGLRIGLALRTGPGLLSGARLRIGRRLKIGASPMRIRPLQHFRLIAKCWSHSLLRPPRQPLPGICGLLREDSTRSAHPEVILPRIQASGGIQFLEHRVSGHCGRKRHAIWRTRLSLLRT
jgi:hypothetical protein